MKCNVVRSQGGPLRCAQSQAEATAAAAAASPSHHRQSGGSSGSGGHSRQQWMHVTCARLMAPQLALTDADRDSTAQVVTGVHAPPVLPPPLPGSQALVDDDYSQRSGDWYEVASGSAGRCCVCGGTGGVQLVCAVAGCRGRVHGLCAVELGLVSDVPPLDEEADAAARAAAAAAIPPLSLSATLIGGGGVVATAGSPADGVTGGAHVSSPLTGCNLGDALLAPLPGAPPLFRYLASPGPPLHPVRLCAAMRAGAPVNPHMPTPVGLPQPSSLAPLSVAARRALMASSGPASLAGAASGRGRPAGLLATPKALFVFCAAHRVAVPCRLEQVRILPYLPRFV